MTKLLTPEYAAEPYTSEHSSLRSPGQKLRAALVEPFNKMDFALSGRATRRLVEHGPRGRPLHVLADRLGEGLFERFGRREALRQSLDEARTPEEILERAERALHSNQKRVEILQLLEAVRGIAPSSVLEIGVAGGGTNLLLSRAHPNVDFVISIDLYIRNKAKLAYFAPRGQERVLFDASSYDPRTVRAVSTALGSRPLDVLFIDGDHSYDGARRDFLAYAPLVRPGGIIAFHDIVPDELTRTGRFTGNWVGEVPALWRDIRDSYPGSREFIADARQDGYGIGLIYCDPGVVPRFSRP